MSISVFRFLNNWEYWPSYMFYVPNVPYAAFLAIRARSLMFFTATNPAVLHSGNGSESKINTLSLLPSNLIPNSVLIERGSSISDALNQVQVANLNYPLILKPDIGFRGLLVKKIDNAVMFSDYLRRYCEIDIIAQEFISHKNECGIFYHKLPGNSQGTITSITLKKYFCVIGNGRDTLRELILSNDRGKRYLSLFEEQNRSFMESIIPVGKEMQLTSIGNHSKGTQFIDGNKLIDKHLECAMDDIFNEIQGWFYGRLDVKYNSIEDLKAGNGFKIIELNGIISEPTHIYDGKSMSYWKALKAIRHHWKILSEIAIVNHRKFKVPYSSIGDFLKSLASIRKHTRHIKKLHQES